MPRFHAGWSVGSIVGAGVGVAMAAADVPLALHVGGVGVLALALVVPGVRAFLPPAPEQADPDAAPPGSAWLEPRTLAVGLMVLAFALVEGSANDWLAVALIDGYDARRWVGVAGFSLFVTAMTTGRLVGPVALDRYGRAPVLWATSALAAAGVLLVVLGGLPGAGRPRHRAVGPGRGARVPGGDERGRRRPGPLGGPGQRGGHDRVRRVPRGPAAARPARQPGRHPGLAAGRGRADGAGGAERAGRATSAEPEPAALAR